VHRHKQLQLSYKEPSPATLLQHSHPPHPLLVANFIVLRMNLSL
jgi:hypothetical protein